MPADTQLYRLRYRYDKFDALANYSSSFLFSKREKAAFDYASELTRKKKVKQETFDRLANHFLEREIVEIVHVVSTEHLYNISNIGVNIHSDRVCNLTKNVRKFKSHVNAFQNLKQRLGRFAKP